VGPISIGRTLTEDKLIVRSNGLGIYVSVRVPFTTWRFKRYFRERPLRNLPPSRLEKP
jgi:hypothetical protein